MSIINVLKNGDFYFFDSTPAQDLAQVLQQRYNSASPFPNIVIDDFLPVNFLENIVALYPNKNQSSTYHTSLHQRFKRGYRPENLGTSPCRSYMYLFNTQPFLAFVESVTGINGLIPDPYFIGAGFHETEPGGKLNIHTDFNYHKKLNLMRRVNVLIFLNKNWKPEYGGHLELWDKKMENCIKSIEPIFNRCVIFNTDNQSFHGHPDPLQCPETMTRRSISLYYYTANGITDSHQALIDKPDWKNRPGTTDKIDFSNQPLYKKLVKKLTHRKT